MDKDLKKIIVETLNNTFAVAPEKLIERGIREIQYDICPHCKTEIHERHEYTEDGGITWRHSECKGLIARPETPLEEVNGWFRPHVEEACAQRLSARRELGYAPLAKDDVQGGTMAAVNVSEIGHRGGEPLDPYKKADDETGIPPESPDNDPASHRYDSKKPTVILHPYPKTVPPHGVNEIMQRKSKNEESKPVAPRDFERFANNMMNFVNASNVPLKVTVTEFTVMADEVHSVKTYIVRVDNG